MNSTQRHTQSIQPQLVACALCLLDIFSQLLLNGKFLSCFSHFLPSPPSILLFVICQVLYYYFSLLVRSWLGWLLERLGGFGFVLFCLLVSTIFSCFLSVSLSVLMSDFGDGTTGLSFCSNISINDLIGFAGLFMSVCRFAPLSIGPIFVFVYPLCSDTIERAEVHFCPDVYNDGYRNVSLCCQKKAMKVPQIRYLLYVVLDILLDSKL